MPLLAGADDETPRDALKALSGKWIVESSETLGKKITKDELPWEWTFTADGKAVLTDRKMGKESQYTYTIDNSKSPQTIDIIYQGPEPTLKNAKQLGIYKLENNKLTILLGKPGGTEKDRPKELAAPMESDFLMRLERAKDD